VLNATICLRPDQLGKQVGNYQTYRAVLNPQSKDFVFIDDRADEREMVNMAMPEVLALDATSDRVAFCSICGRDFFQARARPIARSFTNKRTARRLSAGTNRRRRGSGQAFREAGIEDRRGDAKSLT